MREELLTFSNNMKTYMEYYGLTHDALAKQIGVDRTSVGKWVTGVSFPRINKVDEMCRVFHCSRSDLIEKAQDNESIERRIVMNRLMARIDTLNNEGIEKIITMIDDLSERYKVR